MLASMLAAVLASMLAAVLAYLAASAAYSRIANWDVAYAVLLLILDNQERAVIAQELDDVQPIIKISILLPTVCN